MSNGATSLTCTVPRSRLGREATATLAYLLHLETTGRAERLPGEVEHWRSILP
jgi:hypothetical protein